MENTPAGSWLSQHTSASSSAAAGHCLVNEARDEYRHYAQAEHGSIINPITGEEVDIMQQCVNLQLDVEGGDDIDDMGAYKEMVADFAEELAQGMTAWIAIRQGQYQKGHINRLNAEDRDNITYDFQYVKTVIENGKKVDKVFVIKDLARLQLKTRHVLVKGDPAGGKTTFAKQLLTWIMRSTEMKWLVPVLVRTIDLIRCKASFVDGVDIIDQFLKLQYTRKGMYSLFCQARVEGRLLVILDGFDEAGALEHTLTHQIQDLLVNECFLVLTSRDMGTTFDNPAFERFRSVRVKELSANQQAQVIKRRLVSEERVENFSTQLTLNPALRLMARNPLLLSVTLAVFESSGLDQDARLNRGKVYSVALDGMLGNIEKAKAAELAMIGDVAANNLKISAQALRTVLRRIAYLAHTSHNGDGVRDFRIDLIKRAIETSEVGAAFTIEHWNDMEDIIKKGRLPVLAWFLDGGEDTFRFAHLTFQEFLCAEQCLLESLKDEDFVSNWRMQVCPDGPEQIIRRGWWQQTLQMYCDLACSSGAISRSGKSLDTALGESFLRLSDDGFSVLELHEGVNDSNILTLVSMLQGNAALKKLSLRGRLSSQGISTFGSLKLSSLQFLCLSGNEIGPEGCKSVATFIESSGALLEELDLTGNIICQGMQKNDAPPPSSLNPRTGHFNSYLVDLHGLHSLMNVVRGHRTLRHIDLRSNFLDLEAGRMLSEMVLANHSLAIVNGIPVQQIRAKTLTEIEFKNRPYFLQRRASLADTFFATGDAELLLELLVQFPQPNLTRIGLEHQALASDREGVVEVFAKLGDVICAAEHFESLSVTGFWDCGVAAGIALGQRIRNHPRLKTIDVCMGSLDFSQIRRDPLETLSLASKRGAHFDHGSHGFRDCGAGILSECLHPDVRKLDMQGMGVGASGYKAVSSCLHLTEIDGILIKDFTETCTTVDLSCNPTQSSGLVACVIARTALMPNLTHLNLAGSNLTSKSHCHVLTPVIGGSNGTGCDGGCDCSHFCGTNAYAKCSQCDLDFCSTCCMSECPMIALAQALDCLPNLVSLSIADCAFQGGRNGPIRSHRDEEGYRVLGIALSRHQKLSNLDISKNYFLGPGFPHLAQGIALMPALNTLIVARRSIDFASWLSAESIAPDSEWAEAELLILARAIVRNRQLCSLDLSAVGQAVRPRAALGCKIVSALVESIQAVGTKPVRRVTMDTLVMDGVTFPFGMVQSGALTCLDMSSEDRVYRATLAPLFALLIDVSTSLTDINLVNHDFGDATDMVVSAVLSLASRGVLQKYNELPLQPPRELEQLDLAQRPVMSHGICVLASTAIPIGNIAELNLQSCGMDAVGLVTLLAAMLRKPTVTSLDVSNQPLAGAGVQALSSFLRLDKKLQVLRARRIAVPSYSHGEMVEFSKALDTNVSLSELDLRENRLHQNIATRLKRTMEEKRSVVPFPMDSKLTFLLCNRHLPHLLRLPEVMCTEVSTLFSDGYASPIVLIFQYCARGRNLYLEDDVDTGPAMQDLLHHRPAWVNDSGSEMSSGEDPFNSDEGSE